MRLLKPWTSQPQQPVGVNWANPLARGISDALLPYQRRTLLGQVVTTTGSVTDGIGVYGRGRTATTGGTADSDGYAGPWVGKSANFSVLVLYTLNAVPAAAARVLSNFSAAASGWTFAPNGANFRAIVASSGANVVLTGRAIATGPKVDVLTSTGTSSAYYENGALIASNGSHTAIAPQSGAVTIGTDASNAPAAPSTCYLAVVWDRVLTASEVAQVSANPWQLFAPRSIWLPAQTAAGGSTITTAAGAATTSTLTGASTAESAITSASGAATASALTGSSVAAAAITQASGAATASTLTGASTAAAAITQADGVATTGTLVGDGLAAGTGAFVAAAGVATTSALAGASTAESAIVRADGVASAATLVGLDASATQSAGGAREKQRRKVQREVQRLNEIALIEAAKASPKYDVAEFIRIDDESDDEEALMLLFA